MNIDLYMRRWLHTVVMGNGHNFRARADVGIAH